jgi:IS30 family transposase
MGNTKTEYNREDLLTAYSFVNSALDIDIADKKRETKYVLGRTLYYMIALKTTNASYDSIAKVVNRHHSTVSHSRKNLFDQLKMYKDVYRYYEIYTDEYIKESIDNQGKLANFVVAKDELDRLSIIEEKYEALKAISLDVTRLTINERAYRDLSAEDRLDYDYRASNILKSFEWKKKELSRKEVFEIINVGM